MIEKKKKYHHGDLRGQLLEAIRELIERDGPDGFTIADACRLAGVSTAAPYKHFRDRHEILRGAVLLAMDRLRAAMQVAADSHPAGDPARIAAIGRAYVTFAQAEPGMFRTMFGLTEGHDEDPELAQSGAETNGLVQQVVAEHLGLSPDAPEVILRAYALWCFVHGHSFLHMDAKLPEGVGEIDQMRLLQIVSEAMLPPAQSAAAN